METAMSDTSLKAYFEEVIHKIGNRQELVFGIIKKNDGLTNTEIAMSLGWSINRVTPRVHELRKMGLVKLKEKRPCSWTNRLAKSWIKADNVDAEYYEDFREGGDLL